ncbi:MAG TPA: Tad domain-containing protein, partial [Thermomicrobiaceae bacterium]|nr:Tad domain-containing protein [Thermomicrobiaceae bacterium]
MGRKPHSSYSRGGGRKRTARGQVLIIFAAALVALVGMVGMATDLGFAFAERRTMQNAADAGALAGTRIIAKADLLHPTSAWSEVQAMVDKNKIGST